MTQDAYPNDDKFIENLVKDLGKDDIVVDMAVIKEGAEVITMTENGYGKRSDIDDYRMYLDFYNTYIFILKHKKMLLHFCNNIFFMYIELFINSLHPYTFHLSRFFPNHRTDGFLYQTHVQ